MGSGCSQVHRHARRHGARVFRNGANQAIRIPVDMSFETDEVTLEKDGEALIEQQALAVAISPPKRGDDHQG